MNVKDADGYTALHLAVKHGRYKSAQALTELGAHPDDNDNPDYMTALQVAYLKGDESLIQLMWEHCQRMSPSPEPRSPNLQQRPSPLGGLGSQSAVPDDEVRQEETAAKCSQATRLDAGVEHEWLQQRRFAAEEEWHHFRVTIGEGVGRLVFEVKESLGSQGVQVYLSPNPNPNWSTRLPLS